MIWNISRVSVFNNFFVYRKDVVNVLVPDVHTVSISAGVRV